MQVQWMQVPRPHLSTNAAPMTCIKMQMQVECRPPAVSEIKMQAFGPRLLLIEECAFASVVLWDVVPC